MLHLAIRTSRRPLCCAARYGSTCLVGRRSSTTSEPPLVVKHGDCAAQGSPHIRNRILASGRSIDVIPTSTRHPDTGRRYLDVARTWSLYTKNGWVRSLRRALLIRDLQRRVIVTAWLVQSIRAEGTRMAWESWSDFLSKDLCSLVDGVRRQMQQYDPVVVQLMARMLTLCSQPWIAAPQPDPPPQQQQQRRRHGDVVLATRRYAIHVLQAARHDPPDAWHPRDLGDVIDTLAALGDFPGPVALALRNMHVGLREPIELCTDVDALLRLLSLLTPGDRLPASFAGRLPVVADLLDRLACVLGASTEPGWRPEADLAFSCACRSVSRHRVRHAAFLAAVDALLARRVAALGKAGLRRETLHPGLVANVAFLLSFMAVEARPVVGSLVRGVCIPDGSVALADPVDNSVTSYGLSPRSLFSSSLSSSSSPPWSISVLDLLQLAWAGGVQGTRRRSLQMRTAEKLVLNWFARQVRAWDAAYLFLVLQSFDWDDKSLRAPLYACRTVSWKFGREFIEWRRIVDDLDKVGGDAATVAQGDLSSPEVTLRGVHTLGIRPGGLIAATGLVHRDTTMRCVRPTTSFEAQLDAAPRDFKDYTTSRAFVFSQLTAHAWRRLPASAVYSLVTLLLVRDEHLLHVVDDGSGCRGKHGTRGSAPAVGDLGYVHSHGCDCKAPVGATRSMTSSHDDHGATDDVTAAVVNATALSGAVQAQVSLLTAWGHVVAVVTVADVLRLERLGQAPSDTCLLAMADAVRRRNERDRLGGVGGDDDFKQTFGEAPAAGSRRVPSPDVLA